MSAVYHIDTMEKLQAVQEVLDLAHRIAEARGEDGGLAALVMVQGPPLDKLRAAFAVICGGTRP